MEILTLFHFDALLPRYLKLVLLFPHTPATSSGPQLPHKDAFGLNFELRLGGGLRGFIYREKKSSFSQVGMGIFFTNTRGPASPCPCRGSQAHYRAPVVVYRFPTVSIPTLSSPSVEWRLWRVYTRLFRQTTQMRKRPFILRKS
jgi:hypothetical protein